MPLSYQNIPLKLLLKTRPFEQASELIIHTFSIDLHFAQVYLRNMRDDLFLHLNYVKSQEGVLEFLNQSPIDTQCLVKASSKNFTFQKGILIHTPESTFSILTTSNFTKEGIADEHGCHLYSEDPFDYSNYRKHFILRSFKNGEK